MRDSCETVELAKLIGENIRYYRRQAGWTQKQLSQKLKKTTVAVSRIENGLVGIRLSTLSELSSLLDVPAYTFLLPRGVICVDAAQLAHHGH